MRQPRPRRKKAAKAKYLADIKYGASGSKLAAAASASSAAASVSSAAAASASSAATASASSAAAGDDDVKVVGERTREERDAELRAEAVALDSDSD